MSEVNETKELTEEEKAQAEEEHQMILTQAIPRSVSFEALQERNKARLAALCVDVRGGAQTPLTSMRGVSP